MNQENKKLAAAFVLLFLSGLAILHFIFTEASKKLGVYGASFGNITSVQMFWIRECLLSPFFWILILSFSGGIFLILQTKNEEIKNLEKRQKEITEKIHTKKYGDDPLSLEVQRQIQDLRYQIEDLHKQLEFQKKTSENTAHQVKSACSACLLSVELIEQEYPENPDLSRLHQGLQRALLISDQFLLSSVHTRRKMPFDFQKTDVLKLVEELKAEENLERLQIEGCSCQFYLDPLWMKEALAAFISNAAEYASSASLIWVTITQQEQVCLIEIENELEKALPSLNTGRYQSIRPGHYGIGLNLAAEVIQEHFGKIQLVNEDGWVQFIIEIPLLQTEGNPFGE